MNGPRPRLGVVRLWHGPSAGSAYSVVIVVFLLGRTGFVEHWAGDAHVVSVTSCTDCARSRHSAKAGRKIMARAEKEENCAQFSDFAVFFLAKKIHETLMGPKIFD